MVVGTFANKGGQYCHYGLMLPRSLVIIPDARSEIGEAQLTVTSRMEQRACRLPFYTDTWLISPLCIDVMMQHYHYQQGQTQIVDVPLMLS
jgi:hypothetical protein